MTDRKYTDDEKVISILEFCVALHANANLTPESVKTLLDLINRQKAEIERLNNNISAMAMTLSNSARATRNDAYKEFAEILASKVNCIPQHHFTLAAVLFELDNSVKEMTEAKE